MTEYQPRTPERLIEILRAQDPNPRSWQQEAEAELAKWVRQAEENSGGWQRCQLLLSEAAAELRHASIFIRTREKMHPDGVKLYDDLLSRIEAEL